MSNKYEATFHGPPLITDHKFRVSGATVAQIDNDMCSWLGTCNKPASAHAETRGKSRREHRKNREGKATQ